jgi:hypothetical protein
MVLRVFFEHVDDCLAYTLSASAILVEKVSRFPSKVICSLHLEYVRRRPRRCLASPQ